MTHELMTQEMELVARAANDAAAGHVFADYRARKAESTLRTQAAALALWCDYLVAAGALGRKQRLGAALFCQSAAQAWMGVSWGLVEGFAKWLLLQGYSVASVNNRLSTVKVYVTLAAKAGIVDHDEAALIRDVRGYSRTEGKRLDERRPVSRVGRKKAEAVVLTAAQAGMLKSRHPATPQGARDRLLMGLLLDLGLRASEAAALTVESLAEPGILHVYRQKTDDWARMALTPDLMAALADYPMPASGQLLQGSRKDGSLTGGMSRRAIGDRVRVLGRDVLGIETLSPHDLRHTWATRSAQESSPFALRDAGGWSNMETPGRYVAAAAVVNEAIVLDY